MFAWGGGEAVNYTNKYFYHALLNVKPFHSLKQKTKKKVKQKWMYELIFEYYNSLLNN